MTTSIEGAGKSDSASAERSSLRRRWDADGAVHFVCDGRGNDAGGDGIRGARGGKFRRRDFRGMWKRCSGRSAGNWLQSSVDPRFSLRREWWRLSIFCANGTITNIQVTQSSSNSRWIRLRCGRYKIPARCSHCQPAYSGGKLVWNSGLILSGERKLGRFTQSAELGVQSPQKKAKNLTPKAQRPKIERQRKAATTATGLNQIIRRKLRHTL